MAAALKSADPLATPIGSISQKPTVNPRHEIATADPLSYQQLAAMATEPAPPAPEIVAPSYDEPHRMDVIEPIYQPQPEMAYEQPAQLPAYAPPQFQQQFQPQFQQPQPTFRAGLLEEAQPEKKKSSFSIEANKNLIILFVVAALTLKLAAPRLRTVPRFATTTGIGLNIQGVLLVGVIIAVGYKMVLYAAGAKE